MSDLSLAAGLAPCALEEGLADIGKHRRHAPGLHNPGPARQGSKPGTGHDGAGSLGRTLQSSLEGWPAALALLAFWALNRSYDGITGDSILYIGRGLANDDPNGVGRDLLFREDGQSAFSVYPAIVERLIPHLGPGGTGITLAGLGLLAWIVSLAFLARGLATGRMRVAIPFMVALLPFGYGAYGVLSYAEPLAVPRPFAEAAVIAGLAALISGRNLLALVLMGIAALFHPIMALAGFAVAFLTLSFEDRRWLLAGMAGLVALAIAAALGLPLVSRLIAAFDPEWWSILISRHPYLFPTQWPLDAYSPLIVQAVTIGIAASLTQGRVRAILLASLAASFIGIVAAMVLGDGMRLVLIVQAQLWRPVWLTAALGAVALALCAGELWHRGGAFRLAFALLVIAWAYALMPGVALCAAAVAGLLLIRARGGQEPSRLLLVSGWLLAGALLAYYEIGTAIGLAHIPAGVPTGAYVHLHNLRVGDLQLIPAAFLLAVLIDARPGHAATSPLRHGCLGLAAIALAALALVRFDDRTPMRKLVETGRPPAELAQLVGNHGGEMLFLPGRVDADEPWSWFHRPNWGAEIQGASIVFSRPLALFWSRRMHTLADLGLIDRAVLTPYTTPAETPIPRLTEAAVGALCSTPDPPHVILATLEAGNVIPAGLPGKTFRLPVPQFFLASTRPGLTWHRFDDYAVIKCADVAGAKD